MYSNIPDYKKLKKLADYLISGKLGTNKFDFGVWFEKAENVKTNLCKTSGCAIGQCPFVFPKDWRISEHGNFNSDILLKRDSTNDISGDGVKFFNITNDEFDALFMPGGYVSVGDKKTWTLGDKAKPRRVGQNILRFIELRKLEQKKIQDIKRHLDTIKKKYKMSAYDLNEFVDNNY